jgi:hypothetical protein
MLLSHRLFIACPYFVSMASSIVSIDIISQF